MDTVYEDNLRLSRLEYRQQHIYLRSQPRCLSLVFGNACNIYCPHCCQPKTGDNLLRPAEIGRELRREFMGLYPYLSTLRLLGGEPFAISGFRDLIEDAAATVKRPIISVSTNGTLIDEEWAERIVRLPFSNLTVSIDGGTPATFARMRRGGDLGEVLANVERIRRWKAKLGSELPYLDSFFVVMRSNFREIPQYLQLMSAHGFTDIALQTVEVNSHNARREPTLERDEAIADGAEIRELHSLMRDVLPRERRRFRMIRTSGMTSLFASQGLDGSFLHEEVEGLYPDSDDLAEAPRPAGTLEEVAGAALGPDGDGRAGAPGCPPAEPAGPALCPNPWTTLFVSENGDVRLCFIADTIGNLYETPLSRIWNCQRAMAQRSDMIAGRYLESGCSAGRCSWREGKKAEPPQSDNLAELRAEMALLADRAARTQVPTGEARSAIAAVRRMVASRDQRIQELEVMFAQLCDNTAAIEKRAQEHIAHLEAKAEAALAELAKNTAVRVEAQQHIDHLEAKAEAAIAALEKNTAIRAEAQQHIAHLEAKAEAAIAALEKNTAIRAEAQQHIAHVEAKAEAALAEFRKQEQELAHYRELPLIRAADALSRFLSRLRRAVLP